MADVSVKMGVTGLSQFKQSMQQATNSVKTIDAQLKANESQLKATGDAETYMANKAGLLKQQLDAQKQVVAAANSALQDMKNRGINPASAEFQRMEKNLANATGKMFEIRAQLKEVESGSAGAKTEAQEMNTELKKIGKGVSFENISNGLHRITDTLQSGARAAVNFGKKLLNSAKDATGWADDLITRSLQTDFSVEELQRMDKVAEFIDTDVDAIINARKRMAKAVAGEGREDIAEIFGLDITGTEDPTDLFWDLGEALVNMGESFDKEAAAQKVFGRSWNELLPLFKAGREEYEKMLSEQSVLSDEEVKKLGEADDAIKAMEQQIADLKRQFWADSSETVINLLQWLVDNKESVLTALTVIAGGFGLLKVGELAIDIKKVVDGFNMIKNMGRGGGSGAPTGGTGGAPDGGTGGSSTWLGGKVAALKSAAAEAAPILAADAAVVAVAVAPAVLTQMDVEKKIKEAYEQTEAAAAVAEAAGLDASTLRRLNAATAGATDERNMFGFLNLNDTEKAAQVLMGLSDPRKRGQLYADIQKYGGGLSAGGDNLWTALLKNWGEYREWQDDDTSNYKNTAGERRVDAPLDPMAVNELVAALAEVETRKLEDQQNKQAEAMTEASTAMTASAAAIEAMPGAVADAIRNVKLTVNFTLGGRHANGLAYVPYDGYHAILDKGETVVPARERASASRNFSSNLYVESMIMNNGTDAAGLAAAMAAAQRRTMSGYGS